jgi:hypothetical protein
MDNNITIIHNQPAGIGSPFDPAFPFVFLERFFDHPICQGVQHAVAGGGTDNKIIRKGSNLFDIQQDNIFTFFIFKGIDNGMGKFECIQTSPLYIRYAGLRRY